VNPLYEVVCWESGIVLDVGRELWESLYQVLCWESEIVLDVDRELCESSLPGNLLGEWNHARCC